MRLSSLQKYILLHALNGRKYVKRTGLFNFYKNKKDIPKKEDIKNIITKSIERLIDRGLLAGRGTKTAHKLYIKEIRLTNKGRKAARKLLGEQQKLPLIKLNKKLCEIK